MRTLRKTRGRRPGALVGALIAAAALFTLVAPASALAAPVLDIRSRHFPPSVPVGTYTRYTLTLSNTGDVATSGDVTVDFTLPAGLKATSVTDEVRQNFGQAAWRCTIAPDSQAVSCVGPDISGPLAINPGREACAGAFGFVPSCRILITAHADAGAPLGILTPTVRACGGGHTTCPTPGANASDPTEIIPYGFYLTSFDGEFLKSNGDPATHAGSHPYTASNEFHLPFAGASNGRVFSIENLQDASADLPPGLLGNPQNYPTCSEDQLGTGGSTTSPNCPPESQVGTVTLSMAPGDSAVTTGTLGVYNMEAPFGTPAVFGFNVLTVPVHVYARLRTGEDYGVTLTSKNAAEVAGVVGVDFDFWGVPADSSHNAQRWCAGARTPGCTTSAPLKPFVSLPTSCTGPVRTDLTVTSWPGSSDSASFLTHVPGDPLNTYGFDGCNALDFSPTLEARPTTNVGDSPSGLDVELRVPQSDRPNGTDSAHLRDATVTLPEGLVINPASANGLEGCSPAQVDLRGPNAASCPDASKVGTVQVDTPLLDHPVLGAVYVATPYQNPFNSLIALYIALNDPQSGTIVKLAGKVSPDPNTGRVSATFADNPQIPFENFRLHFFGGAGGALRTPAICGNHTTTSSLTPWSAPDSGPPGTPPDTWSITQGCANSPAEQPHAPSFDAGAVSPIAGAHSPFVVHLRRDDGSQNFAAVTVRPPQGLVAKLAGTPACSDAALAAAANKSGAGERASPSCPAASEVGDVTAGAGAGPAPYYAGGKVYLAGPYKGAPISLATVIPATAGPFDLGTVVTRIAAHINPATAEITAASDPIPHILQGIPLNVKTVSVALDKPDFSLNPTSCDPMAVTGQLLSTIGALANLSSRFQLGECTSLGFKPRMALRLKGGTARGKHPQLSAFVLPRPGDANIRSVSVAFPRSEFLENAHIRTICTRPDFAADRCPAGAAYGTSTVFTPLLDYPLTGNVYLRSSNNLLPDIVPDLRGPAHQPIKLEAAGRTDSIRGGIRNTFDFFPDAPFTRAILRMQGGNKGLLVNSRNICARTYRAKVRFVGHNGARHTIRPKLVAKSCKKKKRRKAKRSAHKRAGGRR